MNWVHSKFDCVFHQHTSDMGYVITQMYEPMPNGEQYQLACHYGRVLGTGTVKDLKLFAEQHAAMFA